MSSSDFDQLRSAVARDLRQALKARDRVAVDALRSALHAVDNTTAVAAGVGARAEVPGRRVGRAELVQALEALAREYETSACEYRRLDVPAEAEALQRQAALIRGCSSHLAGSAGAAPEGPEAAR